MACADRTTPGDLRASATNPTPSSRGLPLLEILLGLGKLLDIVRGVLEGDEPAATGQGNGIVEGARPISHDAIIRGIRCSLKIGQVNLLGRGE